ncbi:Lipoprotein signal peptidase [Desulfamplus magnetovallimortis]|uniref:Lipoprotein signal peptidase n=1 Tax=Desulfamplus magnetovallimortis TaxID=1246637 RepID=A0A1W1H5G0_9BACT|nr:signal peptidase II [Desulfamplus magnetovallimortis]SLM27720.1 Lipoprotein signal peptidase [Desulfamplus magnetovallimortis]
MTTINQYEGGKKIKSLMNLIIKDPVRRLLLISGTIIVFDQITKYLIISNFMLHETMAITGFFNITHVLNPGGAFGLFADHSAVLRKFFFLFVSSAVALILLWFYKKTWERYTFFSCGLAAIFGGAVGNLIDRFRYGKVVDFLDFYIGYYHWPAFNVADSAICVGMGIFVYHVITNNIPEF